MPQTMNDQISQPMPRVTKAKTASSRYDPSRAPAEASASLDSEYSELSIEGITQLYRRKRSNRDICLQTAATMTVKQPRILRSWPEITLWLAPTPPKPSSALKYVSLYRSLHLFKIWECWIFLALVLSGFNPLFQFWGSLKLRNNTSVNKAKEIQNFSRISRCQIYILPN